MMRKPRGGLLPQNGAMLRQRPAQQQPVMTQALSRPQRGGILPLPPPVAQAPIADDGGGAAQLALDARRAQGNPGLVRYEQDYAARLAERDARRAGMPGQPGTPPVVPPPAPPGTPGRPGRPGEPPFPPVVPPVVPPGTPVPPVVPPGTPPGTPPVAPFDPTDPFAVLNKNITTGSPYLEVAKQNALEIANSRGMLNSSIAAGSGARAAIEAASPFALQGAGTAAEREFQGTGIAADKAAQAAAFGQQTKLQGADIASQQKIAQLSADTQTKLANLDAATRANLAQLDADTQTAVANMNVAASQQQAAAAAAASAAQVNAAQWQAIMSNPNILAADRAAYLASIGATQAANLGIVESIYNIDIPWPGTGTAAPTPPPVVPAIVPPPPPVVPPLPATPPPAPPRATPTRGLLPGRFAGFGGRAGAGRGA